MSKKKPYFEGWYFKHEKEGQSFAVIPGIRRDDSQGWFAFIQVITEKQSYFIPYSAKEFGICREPLRIRIGDNIFSEKGIRLSISNEQLSLTGILHYEGLSPVAGDIMGPFAHIPGMECSHGIISMSHSLAGSVALNGKRMDFRGGTGFIETDKGRSFPRSYFWTQCNDQEVQLMAAAAVIPLGCFAFDGCICVIRAGGKEYRLATYYGARIEKWTENSLVIRQHKQRLEIRTRKETGKVLKAPAEGRMDQEIEERLRAEAFYRLTDGKQLVFEMETSKASLESFFHAIDCQSRGSVHRIK